ncbi:MAG: hypothetical protein GXP45_07740 [bacterium]|nr:hypothetical protein [bacterium]
MFNRILDKLAGDYNTKELKKIIPLVDKINNYYKEYETLSDKEIQAKTSEFQKRLQE